MSRTPLANGPAGAPGDAQIALCSRPFRASGSRFNAQPKFSLVF